MELPPRNNTWFFPKKDNDELKLYDDYIDDSL
jgi:hypothetical protein